MMQQDLLAELPMGFGMALAQEPGAISYFGCLSPEERRRVTDEARQIRSKEEMRAFVRRRFAAGRGIN